MQILAKMNGPCINEDACLFERYFIKANLTSLLKDLLHLFCLLPTHSCRMPRFIYKILKGTIDRYNTVAL